MFYGGLLSVFRAPALRFAIPNGDQIAARTMPPGCGRNDAPTQDLGWSPPAALQHGKNGPCRGLRWPGRPEDPRYARAPMNVNTTQDILARITFNHQSSALSETRWTASRAVHAVS